MNTESRWEYLKKHTFFSALVRVAATAVLASSLSMPAFAQGTDLSALDTELQKTWPNNRTINFIFHGHSVPSGYHVTPAVKPFESYPYLFNVMLKEQYPYAVVNMINTAIGGENSIAGAARFNTDVIPRKPDLIFIDYAINDRSQDLADVETAWRSMITNATAAGVPVILLTPTGVSGEDLSNPTNALAERAELIRTIAADEGVLLADVSAAWLDALDSGTNETNLLSQGNHPNLAGHQIAADAIWSTYAAAAGLSLTTYPTDFPLDGSTNTFTTADGKLTFVTSNTFFGPGGFLGDSGGGTLSLQYAWDAAETLDIAPAAGAYLTGFGMVWCRATIIITGFNADPGATISAGTATWNEPAKTLTLDVPWDAGAGRTVTFADASASAGSPLHFAFTGSSGYKVSFTSFSYKTN